MDKRTRWLLIFVVAVFGHFLDGWVNPLHETVLGWWLWHAANWVRRDIVLVILLWPLIMGSTATFERFTRSGWQEIRAPRYDLPERIAWWSLAAAGNYLAHQILYHLGILTRSVLQ